MNKRFFLGAVAVAAATLVAGNAMAQANTFKIGLILPMTGQQASTGKQIEAAARLYMAQNGNTVAGKKIELIVKDDGGLPDASKRIAQELWSTKRSTSWPVSVSPRLRWLQRRLRRNQKLRWW